MDRRRALGFLGAGLLIGSLFSLWKAISVSAERDLSQLETTLFGVLTFILSLLGSAALTLLMGREQAREEYVQLARPALRRVVELLRSSGQIGDAIRAKQEALRREPTLSPEVAGEWLDAVARLVKQHSGQLGAAIADWQELLPKEYEQLVNLAELMGEYEEKISRLETVQQEQTQQAKAARRTLQQELKQLRKEIQDSKGFAFTTSSPVTISSWEHVIPVRSGQTFDIVESDPPYRETIDPKTSTGRQSRRAKRGRGEDQGETSKDSGEKR